MRNWKSKFIITFIALITVFLWFFIFRTDIDRNSYVILLDWEATLNNSPLELEKKLKLSSNDKIKTIGKKSFAMIKWWDWSITRIWGNSVLVIEESNIDKNLLSIKIAFELKEWKTWSDVISFIWSDSHFHQRFAGTTAVVIWTTFEVNLVQDYLNVSKHEVKLIKNSWEQKIITQWKPFVISDFSFISLLKFIKEYQDTTFKSINIKLDKKFYNDLVNKIGEISDINIKNISKLTNEKKQEIYNKILSEYQKLNFIKTDDIENYRKKLDVKKILIKLSDDNNKENLLVTTLYDFKDLAKNKQFIELTEIIKILWENKQDLKNLDLDLSKYLNIDILKNIKIPDSLNKEFQNSLNSIKSSLNNLDNNNLIDSAKKSLNDVKDKLNKLKEKIINK
jgi:hypothetical protein